MSLDLLAGADRSAVLAAALRRDFVSFNRKVFGTVSPGVEYRAGWHLEAVAWHLNEVACGRLNRLVITMPPRNMKSIMASVSLPAFALGHDPGKRIIAVSYAHELTIKHAADFRAVIGSDWYRNLFPQTRIDRKKNTEREVRMTERGFRFGTSVGGTLTGRGGDLIIIDDPLKPQDAMSEPRRRFVNEWFGSTLMSRLDDKRTGAVVIVMQRLHADDLVGYVLETQPGWTHLNLPAIAEAEETIRLSERRFVTRHAGDVLHPEREPLEVLAELRAALGSNVFAAQYQQSPVPAGGAMIKREWLKRYTFPPRENCYRVQSWDIAQKAGQQNDYSVGTTWLVHGRNVYLLDVYRGRVDYPTLKQGVIQCAEKHKPIATILVEDAGTGPALVQELHRQGMPVILRRPQSDKLSRMWAQSAQIEAGRLFLPETAPWLADFETELLSFPYGRHDDQVDTVSQLLAWLESRYGSMAVFGTYSSR